MTPDFDSLSPAAARLMARALWEAQLQRGSSTDPGVDTEPEAPQAPPAPGELITVKRLAGLLGVTEDWVYEHQRFLGVFRLGAGPKAPLRFDYWEVRERMSGGLRRPSRDTTPAPKRRNKRKPSPQAGLTPSGNQLVPIPGLGA